MSTDHPVPQPQRQPRMARLRGLLKDEILCRYVHLIAEHIEMAQNNSGYMPTYPTGSVAPIIWLQVLGDYVPLAHTAHAQCVVLQRAGWQTVPRTQSPLPGDLGVITDSKGNIVELLLVSHRRVDRQTIVTHTGGEIDVYDSSIAWWLRAPGAT